MTVRERIALQAWLDNPSAVGVLFKNILRTAAANHAAKPPGVLDGHNRAVNRYQRQGQRPPVPVATDPPAVTDTPAAAARQAPR